MYKLIGLEIEALQAEHEETMKNIALYKDILDNYDSMAAVIIKDMDASRKNTEENAVQRLKMQKKLSMKRRRWKRWKSAS